MKTKDELLSICNYSMAMLFTETASSIYNIKKSVVDIQSSLLSELSSINCKIEEDINFNSKNISSEYIDYLISVLSDVRNITMSNDSTNSINKLSSNLLSKIKYSGSSNLSSYLKTSESKISSILKYDIHKTSSLLPIITSKINDVIVSARNRLIEVSIISNDIINKIQECSELIEACCFCSYYLSLKTTKEDQYLEILEEPPNKIISILTVEYLKWKGEK